MEAGCRQRPPSILWIGGSCSNTTVLTTCLIRKCKKERLTTSLREASARIANASGNLAPNVQRADNFSHWIGCFPTDKMCRKIFPICLLFVNVIEAYVNISMGLCGKLAKIVLRSTFGPLDNDLSTG